MPLTTAPPASLQGPEGPREGLWLGALTAQMLTPVPGGRGRVRRWSYAAASTPDGSLSVGAAVVDLGPVGTTFVWVHRPEEGRVRTWEAKVLGRALTARDPDKPARAEARGALVAIGPTGGLQLAVADVDGEPLHVDLEATAAEPVVCATPTPGGGWNATEKSAGYAVRGTVTVGQRMHAFDGLGWRDWTAGRQDRHTTWRWAAGAGRSRDGRAVGLNASTGMNAAVGEDVAWIDGRPVVLDVRRLAPSQDGRHDGTWLVEGEGWGLEFRPSGVRAAQENLLLVRSRYVQPIGTFHGTVPSGDGGVVEVDGLPGVTEDHEARW